MTKKFLFLGLVGAVWASAQTATLPPGQDQAINSAIHFFQDLKTLMDNTVNASRSPLMAVGCFLWFFFAAKTFFQLVGHFAKETVSGHHHNHLLQGLYLWFIRISVAAMLLIGYFSPTYNGMAFSKIIPGIAHYLSSAIELDAVKSVFVQFNAVFHMATPNAWNLLMVYEYAMLIVVMAVAEIAMTVVTASSYVFMGALTFTGPLWIPFFIEFQPRWHSIFWSWVGDQIVYSMYQVFSDVFVAVFAGMYLNFFCRIMNNCATPTPTYTVGQFLGETAYLLLLTVSFVIVMWQIPSFTARRFGGFGELGQEWSNSVQRYVISRVFRYR